MNKKIQVFNRKLNKLMKRYNHREVIDISTNRITTQNMDIISASQERSDFKEEQQTVLTNYSKI